MFILNLFFSSFVGMTTFIGAMLGGSTFLRALGLYSVAGMVTFVTLPLCVALAGAVLRRVRPVAAQQNQAVAASASALKTAPRQINILAVDDDPFILDLLPHVTAGHAGFALTTADSAAAALELVAANQTRFDMFLLDINMPEMDGIALTGRIRQMAAYRDTPVLMLTAKRDMKNMGAAFKAGATDYVTKPFDLTALGQRLAELVMGAGAEANALIERKTLGHLHTGMAQSGVAALLSTKSVMVANNILTPAAFTNYLDRLPKAAVNDVFVQALTISQPADAGSTDGVKLSDVANAAATLLQDEGLILTYAGRGQFLMASRMEHMMAPAQFKAGLAAALGRKLSGTMQLSVGFPVVLDASSDTRGRNTVAAALVSADEVQTLSAAARSGAAQSA